MMEMSSVQSSTEYKDSNKHQLDSAYGSLATSQTSQYHRSTSSSKSPGSNLRYANLINKIINNYIVDGA